MVLYIYQHLPITWPTWRQIYHTSGVSAIYSQVTPSKPNEPMNPNQVAWNSCLVKWHVDDGQEAEELQVAQPHLEGRRWRAQARVELHWVHSWQPWMARLSWIEASGCERTIARNTRSERLILVMPSVKGTCIRVMCCIDMMHSCEVFGAQFVYYACEASCAACIRVSTPRCD